MINYLVITSNFQQRINKTTHFPLKENNSISKKQRNNNKATAKTAAAARCQVISPISPRSKLR